MTMSRRSWFGWAGKAGAAVGLLATGQVKLGGGAYSGPMGPSYPPPANPPGDFAGQPTLSPAARLANNIAAEFSNELRDRRGMQIEGLSPYIYALRSLPLHTKRRMERERLIAEELQKDSLWETFRSLSENFGLSKYNPNSKRLTPLQRAKAALRNW